MFDCFKVEHDPFVDSQREKPSPSVLQKREHNWTSVQKSTLDDLAQSLIVKIENVMGKGLHTDEYLD